MNTEKTNEVVVSSPIALFINNINIDPNLIQPDKISQYIELTKKMKDDDNNLDTVVDGFMEPESRYKLFCFGEVSVNNDPGVDISSIDTLEFYEKLIQEILKAEKTAIEEKSEILSITFPINNFECFSEIYDVGNFPVFGNGDLLFINYRFYFCNGKELIEINSERLKEIIS
jgi:hypothetical protein